MIQDKDGIKTLVITEAMLAELERSDLHGVWMACCVISKHFPGVLPDEYYLDRSVAKKWANIHVVNASASLGDRYFMARVCFMTVETVLNQPLNYFKLRFPYIEGNG